MNKIFLYALLVLITAFSGCTRTKEYHVSPVTIDPSDPRTFSKYIGLPAGTNRHNGSPPSSTATGNEPSVQVASSGSIVSSNGSTVAIPLNFNIPPGSQVEGFFLQVDGADEYFELSPDPEDPTRFTLPINIPSAALGGTFCVNIWVYDDLNRVSTPVQQCVEVVQLGTGSLQVNLSWDTGGTDVDLHVIEPGGFEIYYSQKISSTTGGELDRDDTDGFGPENIFWENAPDGTYRVSVVYFSGDAITNYYVTINSPGGSRTYEGVLSGNVNREKRHIVNIEKRGNSYSFIEP